MNAPPPPAQAPASGSGESPEPTLRVMRLYKPRLASRGVLPCCPQAATLHPATAGIHEALDWGAVSDFSLGNCLLLPDSFGNIYMGEKFTAYISVLNHLPNRTLTDVELSVKLQSPGTKSDLKDKRLERGGGHPPPNPAPFLASGEHIDMVVEQSLTELGVHTLRVSVTYRHVGAPMTQEPKSLRKFYRFNVHNPINMSMTCLLAGGCPLVEMAVRNTTQMDLLLESYEFIPEADSGLSGELLGGGSMVAQTGSPGPLYSGSGMHSSDNAGWGLESSILLSPDDIHQFVYRVEAKGGLSRGSHTLGRIELCWRTTFGESGSVLSAPIICSVLGGSGVEVKIEGVSGSARVGELEHCMAVITNMTDRPLQLQLQFPMEDMVGVHIHGRSVRNLGEVGPGKEHRCPIDLLPLVAGLHELKGCVVMDMMTAQAYPQGKLCDILVES